MTKLLACLLGVFVSLQAAQAPAAADKPKDEKCAIEGRVVNSVTNEAVRRVTLMLTPSGASSVSDIRRAESDDNGQFAFPDLNPGRYSLVAQRTGFATQAYGARSSPQNGVPLVLSAGQQVKGLLFKLPPNAVITGRVLDSEGEPLGSVMVVALRPGYQRGERQWLPLGTAQTNDLGEFRMANLAAGSYIVAATSSLTVTSLIGTSGKAASDKPEMSYVMTYYPNATDTSGATAVRAEVGGESRLADIRLLQAPSVRISGKLVGGDAETKAVIVRLVPKGRGEAGGVMSLLTGKMTAVQQSSGSFELRGVTPGVYTLTGMSSDLQTPAVGGQTIQVGERNIEGILLQLGAGGEVAGLVTVEGKDTVNLEKAQVQLQPRDFVVLSAPRGSIGEGGKFTLKGVAADRFLVQVNNGPEGSYLKSVRYGGQDVTEEGLDLDRRRVWLASDHAEPGSRAGGWRCPGCR